MNRVMKDSGVEWIGQIPNAWSIAKMKQLGKYINGYAFKPEDWNDTGIPIVRIQDLTGSNNEPNYFNGIIDEKYYIKRGDILVSWAATLDAFVWNNGNGWLNQHIFKAIPNEDLICNDYFFWLLKVAMNYMNDDNKHGIMMQHVTLGVFNNFLVPLPNKEYQIALAKKLNIEAKNAEQLIFNQEQQIEKLKAYKQSLITEVVTRGLNPNAPMKDSGVDWIGSVNADYEVLPINALFSIEKRILGKEPETVLSITQSGIIPKDITVNAGQMANSYAHYQIVEKGDFAMNHMDLLTGGIGISDYNGVTSPDYRVFVLDEPMNKQYFLYVFQTYYKNKIFYAFGQGAANLGRWRLPATNFKKIAVPVPSVKEQNEIVEYLDSKCSQIDKLIEIKQEKIEKLELYKKSLIYEYVTGKKEAV